MRALETSDYRLADKDIDAVTRLCDALDGLPLAIEIVAAKLAHFRCGTPQFRGCHISELRNANEDTHSRHQTLWATLDWSYRLLSRKRRHCSGFYRLRRFLEWNDVNSMARLVHFDPYQTTVALGSRLKVTSFGRYRRRSTPYRLLESTKSYAVEKLRGMILRETQT